MKVTTLGIDIAKSIFHLHGVNERGKTVLDKKVTRSKLLQEVRKLPPCTIGMEACGGAHHWGREFETMGHTVKLMHARYVKPYVQTNKNDGRDAAAICEAVTRPHMRFVPVKTVDQQDMKALLTVRDLLVKQRTALVNQIRGLLSELGIVFPRGAKKVLPELAKVLDGEDSPLTSLARETFRELRDHLKDLERRIAEADKRVARLHKAHAVCQKLSRVPGIGPITAVALVATLPGISFFENGRHLSAWLGLVPRQNSSGGKNRLGRISKRGDRSLRTLLIHGARSVVRLSEGRTDPLGQWIRRLATERGANKAAVALANKNARVVFALLSRDGEYRMPA